MEDIVGIELKDKIIKGYGAFITGLKISIRIVQIYVVLN
jgi:hypothetical protein